MNNELKALLSELYEIDPSFRGKEAELVKIIEKLRLAKPDAKMDEGFKRKLKKQLLFRIEQKQSNVIDGFFGRNKKLVFGFGLGFATVAVLLTIIMIAVIPHGPNVVLEKSQSESQVLSQDKTSGAADEKKLEQKEDNSKVAKAEKLREKSDSEVSKDKDVTEMPSIPESVEERDDASRSAEGSLNKSKASDLELSEPGKKTETIAGNTKSANTGESVFLDALDFPLSTIVVDSSTASYASVRKSILQGKLPQPDAVHIEELVNYFAYEVPVSDSTKPVSVFTETASCPWDETHRLLLVAVRGNAIASAADTIRTEEKPASARDADSSVIAAKDVRIQVELDSEKVDSYRLVGNSTRVISEGDFSKMTTGTNAVAAGHSIVTLYEIVPAVRRTRSFKNDATITSENATSGNRMLTLRLRYEVPGAGPGGLIEIEVSDSAKALAAVSSDTRFAAAVAEWGLLLSQSGYRGNATIDRVYELARGAVGQDIGGSRKEFLSLVDASRKLIPGRP